MSNIIMILFVVSLAILGSPESLAIDQPSFIQGDGEQQIEASGGRAFNIISGILATIAALTFMVGIGFYMVGKADQGKEWMVRSGVGLILIGSVSLIYNIAG